MSAQLADHEARRAIREDLDATLVVEAAAGAGKTTELVRRVLALLQTGRARLSTIVAVTFTEKAAGEMKLRLRTAIERERIRATDAEVRERLEGAARELEVAHIGTIHGFCADLLRERPVEAGIDPLFTVADEGETRRLYREAFEPWFQAVLNGDAEAYPGVHRVLRRRSRDESPHDMLLDAGYRLVEQRDFDAPWTRPVFDRVPALDEICAALADLGALALDADDMSIDKENKPNWLYISLDSIARFSSELARKEAARGGERDYDGLEAELRRLARERHWAWGGRGSPNYSRKKGLSRQDVADRRAALKSRLDALLTTTDADLAACLREELRPLAGAYEALKARAGKLDFLDLLLKTRDLLDENPGTRRALRARYTHLLVDEFQDTDPLQAHILFSLGRAADDDDARDERGAATAAPAPGKLFFVGDPKQSIYRFRRADVAFYEATKRQLVANGARLVHLTTSFRSTPDVQSVVNATFARAMVQTEEGSQAAYVPLSGHRAAGPEAQPAIVALPVPRPYSAKIGKIAKYSIEESLPDAVGAFVDWLVHKSGYTVQEQRDNRPVEVPVTAGHVCLLFKRFSSFGGDVTRPYVRALEARHVPHVLVGGRGFHEREEVLALRNAATAIEYPFDEYAVYATLKGPLFALPDAALFAYRALARSLDPRRPPPDLDALTAPVAEALAVLRELHGSRNRRPFADTLAELLERTRAHAGFAIWPTGEQALANVLRVLDVARKATHAPGVHSFRAFVTALDEDASRGNVSEAFVAEEDAAGVRMMTVHRAKGLEFPVVILADPTARPTHTEPSRFVDAQRRLFAAPLCGAAPLELSEHRDRVLAQDHEEAVRLLYVATTRARDMLVVPVVGDEPLADSWLEALGPTVYPPQDRRARPSDLKPTPLPFGADSVLDRPEKVWNARPVRPGWHAPAAGTHEVLFFDPAALGLGKEDEAGLRQQKILAADDGGGDRAAQARYDAWVVARDALRETASAPSVRVVTPTELKDALNLATPATVEPLPALPVHRTVTPREGRPHGKRYGVLVHALLAEAPLDGSHGALLPALARAHGRSLGATEEEIAFAARAAGAALEHELLARARASTDARREVGITLRTPDGRLVEGVVDLAFREADGSTTVIDFKTDVDEGPRLASYRAQLALYAEAIAASTGAPARGVLLLV
ncbi:MAG: UvrD-helicase domain-containing protein [Myxococcales bacterium]|nr:UvrD-helicase domain-containing protein [Myxococcales bacterium]MBL0197900.1 UvrD-helicase domain-containing protein [Myxococcales bacterium]HQY60959.1 UvrD-helicase domain-containing protein [Polyangiaceae bacterium]